MSVDRPPPVRTEPDADGRVSGTLPGARDVVLWWRGAVPVGPVRGVLLICHGLGEHSGRYRGIADAARSDGWAVYGLDLRGHGRSGGHRVHLDAYADWTDDYHAFRRHVVARHPDVPVVLFGHSMGGQIALSYALAHGDGLAGLALSAPFLVSSAVSAPLVWLLRRAARVAPRARVAGIDVTKLSRDAAVVADYRGDPLVFHGHPTLALGAALYIRADTLVAEATALTLPLLCQHGTDDAIVDPAGTRALAAAVSTTDLTVTWYPGLWHEIHHEPERARPLADLRAWLADRC